MGYLAASAFCILSINGLSAQQSARSGATFGVAGVIIGTVTTMTGFYAHGLDQGLTYLMLGSMGAGGVLGMLGSSFVGLTELPQMVALFHSFVGVAATTISIASFMNGVGHYSHDPTANIHKVAIYLGTLLGGLTFTGSLVAFAKLQGSICGIDGIGGLPNSTWGVVHLGPGILGNWCTWGVIRDSLLVCSPHQEISRSHA